MLIALAIIAVFLLGFWTPRYSRRVQRFLIRHLKRAEHSSSRLSGILPWLLERAFRLTHRGVHRAAEAGRKRRDRAPF